MVDECPKASRIIGKHLFTCEVKGLQRVLIIHADLDVSPHMLLEASKEILLEVDGIDRVLLDITPK